MKRTLLPLLACPECAGELTLESLREEGAEIMDGRLFCAAGHTYPVWKGVPRMVADSLIPDGAAFYEQYPSSGSTDRALTFKKLQEKTVRNFGDEWKYWDDFGWSGGEPTLQTKQIFDYKVLATPEELTGKLVLDAGCGNGRYTAVARAYGGTVVGVDLSDAVDVAFKNLGRDEGVHIVQGDLFKLPFKKRIFGFVFSNGVLMHTGDARRAFHSIASHMAPDGAITVHLYHKGNFIYEFNDWWMRIITTRLPLSFMYWFSSVLTWIATHLPRRFVEFGLNSLFRIEHHAHYNFDWYTAPIATHHTYPEVYGWLKEANLHLVHDHNATNYPWRAYIRPFFFLTVKAQAQPISGAPLHTRN